MLGPGGVVSRPLQGPYPPRSRFGIPWESRRARLLSLYFNPAEVERDDGGCLATKADSPGLQAHSALWIVNAVNVGTGLPRLLIESKGEVRPSGQERSTPAPPSSIRTCSLEMVKA